MKKLHIVLICFAVLLTILFKVFLSYEVTTYNDPEVVDIRFPLFDTQNIVFDANNPKGESREGIILVALGFIGLVFIGRLFHLMYRTVESVNEGVAFLVSITIVLLGELSLLFIISLIPQGGFYNVMMVITGFLFFIVTVGQGIAIVEEEKGFFSVYETVEDYLRKSANRDRNITRLNNKLKKQLS